MAKFLYSAAMSVDGFIAGPNGDMLWLADSGTLPLFREIDASAEKCEYGAR